MQRDKKPKNYNPKPAVTGTMECDRQHRWWTRDLNPERGSVPCPVCGGLTSVAKGFQYDGQQGQR